ncbi:MAG: M61 family metallopeptidase, partial [Gammaproteobacteria bacterium]|nr:M61 family metallopeptidase [Gammaproteobacteria bacterium]
MHTGIRYTIQASSPRAHLFTVHCHIDHPEPAGQIVSLPSWIPGSYMIRDFCKNIVTIKAHCEGREIALRKLDKSSWQCEACDGSLELEYEVYAWDLSVRSAHLDQSHAYFNGTSVFIAVQGREQEPCEVELLPPAGPVDGNWRVATGMPRKQAELYDFGLYEAENYDALIDYPVEMADFSLASFEVAGVPHDIVISGRHQADMDRLCRDLTEVCRTHVEMYGELPSMDRYTFLVMVVGEGYGGLEHRNSTSLLCSRDNLPLAHQMETTESYRSFLGLCSHEYFHTWNVKRIKPEVFHPYDLSRETPTRQLWAFEGITAYYDDLGLARSGLIDEGEYLELLGQTITRVWRGTGRHKQSVADSSFDAWTKFYKQDENAPNAIVSYYAKGSLIAFGLDMTLRFLTEGTRSLDNLMQHLWQEYGKPGIGVPEGRIETLASEICGQDLSGFFEQYLYGTGDMPLAEWFKQAGVGVHWRAATS